MKERVKESFCVLHSITVFMLLIYRLIRVVVIRVYA